MPGVGRPGAGLLPATLGSAMSPLLTARNATAADVTPRPPLTLAATVGGAAAAAGPLVVCLALGVVGWFATDAGAHGTPTGGLRVGALGWLLAHGSGLQVRGAAVTVVPLGLTLVCAWVVWRLGIRVGESVSGHGPDADAIADGERDLTVPLAVTLFAAAYLAVTVLTGVLSSSATTSPAVGRTVLWALALCLLVGAPGIAVGSGRAAIWTALLPVGLRATAATAGGILLGFLSLAAVAMTVAFIVDFGTAANVLARLHTDAGESALFTLLTASVTPNAVVFSGAYLLGPGFAVGTGTLVSPTLVSLGPVPMLPLLAALPEDGPGQPWTPYLVAMPFLVAAVGAAYNHRRHPTTSWDQGVLRGCVGGALAALAFTLLAWLAGGSAGPGRMAEVSPFVLAVLVNALASFGIGGALGGLFMTWRDRRRAAPGH